MSKSFKEGNTVRFTHVSGLGHSKSVQHRLYTVQRYFMGELLDLIDSEGTCITVSDYRVELVSERELPLTNGDKAVITHKDRRYDAYREMAEGTGLTNWASHYSGPSYKPFDGEVVTVLSAIKHQNHNTVIYAVECEDGSQHLYGESGIAKYVAPVAPVFNVGDRVRVKADVVNPRHAWGYTKRGDVGVVTHLGGVSDGKWIDAGDLLVDFPAQNGWTAKADEMELVTTTPLEEAQDEIERLKKVLAKKDAELVEVRQKVGQVAEMLEEI